jgi:hypothetical protein
MSEIVTGNTDALAAEYVLGTLDPDERTQAQGLLESDQDFAAKVRLWERRLGELHLMVEPVEPDGKIWERIKGKMPELIPAPETSPAPASSPQNGTPAPETTPLPPSPEATHAATSGGGLPPTPTLPPPLPPAPAASPAAATTFAQPAPTPAAATAPPPAAVPVLTPGAKRTPDVEPKAEPRKDQAAVMKGRLTRWRVFAVLMLLLVLAVAALLSAWRFVPERVPPVLRPAEVLRVIGVTVAGSPPLRRPAPPESQFDE